MQHFKKILNLIGYAIGTAIYFAEHGFVLTLEGLRRIALRFDPRVYDEKRRVLKVDEGAGLQGGNKFVVFVIYCNGPLPAFTRSAIEAFGAAGFDVVAVLNLPPHPQAVDYLNRQCRLIIHRANVGRDFGGYKDAISVVLKRFGTPERLVIANDSIFFLERGLAEMVAGLDGPEDFIGASEVFDHHYHVGSYLLSFSRKAIESDEFQQFWKRYKPLTTRRWAILKGEGPLTAALVRAGFPPKVLFKAEDLRGDVRVSSPEAFLDLVRLLPLPSRNSFARSFAAVLHQLQQRRSGEAAAVDTASPIIDAVIASNQMHTGGFLFRRFMDLPIIKRDIVFRDLYDLAEVRQALSDLPPDMLAEVMNDLTGRGSSAKLDAWKRLLHRHSAI